MTMDDVDARIVSWLERDGRMSWRELGERIGLSPTATRDRTRALIARGIIQGFHARVDTSKLGNRISAIIDVRLRSPDHAGDFEAVIRDHTRVDEAFHLTGRADYVVRVSCPDTDELDAFINLIKRRGGVRDTETRVVLRTVV